jgi:hypothetical protein
VWRVRDIHKETGECGDGERKKKPLIHKERKKKNEKEDDKKAWQ